MQQAVEQRLDPPNETPKNDSLKRDVSTETVATEVGSSGAKSSVRRHYYHLICPEIIRRLALRKTVGGSKYGPVNARAGMNDRAYVADRLNHMFSHMLALIESGNIHDDNLGAIAWSVEFLMEVETKHPEVWRDVIGFSQVDPKYAKTVNQYQHDWHRLANDEKTEP